MANVLDRNTDFLTNGTVTSAGLHNLIDDTNIYAGLISTQAEKTTVGTADLILVADSSSIGSPQIAANRTTVYNLFDDALTSGTYASLNLSGALTYGTATGNRTISTSATITTGTIATLNSTTGTIATLNSTTGTIPTLVATTLITTGTGTAAAPAIVPTGDTNTGIFFPAADTLAATTNGTERLRIDSSGNVGIGTTPTSKLHVYDGSDISMDASGSGQFSIQGNGYSTSIAMDATGTFIYNNGSSRRMVFGVNETERLRIDSNGGITIADLAGSGSRAVNASAAGLLSAASDASLKEEVVGAHIAGLVEILKIHPKMYRWKDDIANRGENASIELGFIANDVAPIIPSAAPIGNDGLYGFYDRSITAALVKAVQELKSENDSLKARIEALEAK